MLFSEAFNLKLNGNEEWFDPALDQDVPLFIDPFLVERTDHKDIKKGFKKFIKYFESVFKLILKIEGKFNKNNQKIVIPALSFKEVQEICLGYAQKNNKGTGMSKIFAKKLYHSFSDYLALGLEANDFKHIEILGLFTEGIGPDRISDMTANIIKKELIKYTQDICKKYKIPCKKKPIHNYEFDNNLCLWIDDSKVFLPENPISKKGIILVPKDILRVSPTIDYMNFLDYLKVNESEVVRSSLGVKITTSMNKKKINKILKKHPEFISDYIKKIIKESKKEPYNLDKDEKFLYKLHEVNKLLYKINAPKLNLDDDKKELFEFIIELCDYFKKSVEMRGLYKFFWVDKHNKRKEPQIQRLFDHSIRSFCNANGVEISPETNVGRGAVDFKFSQTHTKRVLLELKFVSNKKYWDGLKKQLPEYMDAEGIKEGIYLIIAHSKEELKSFDEIKKLAIKVGQQKKINIVPILIDASLDKPSASKL